MRLKEVNLEPLKQYIYTVVPDHFKVAAGTEAYALYAHYSLQLPKGSKIADLGTLQGLSALALAYNDDVQVLSYDIDLRKNIVKKPNITFIEANCFDKLDEIMQCDLILVDVDPHDGLQEMQMLSELMNRGYKGKVLWDDIHLNPGMRAFWQTAVALQAKERVVTDLTTLGHHSGTGLIEFK